jgi:tail-anchored protein insertion receptor
VIKTNGQVYSGYQRIFNSSAVTRQRQLKTEILATKAELLQTSAQDQFAKWAKLRRNVDKGLAELEKLSTS